MSQTDRMKVLAALGWIFGMSYRVVADQLGIEHRVCNFRLRRWVGRGMRELAQAVPKEQSVNAA